MSKHMRVLVMGGDGIGPEVVEACVPVMLAMGEHAGLEIALERYPAGGALYDLTGQFVDDELKQHARDADVILFGAEGGPKWDHLELDTAPDVRSALSWMRMNLELYCNFRPVKPFASLLGRSSLKRELVAPMDLVVVRELSGGIYFAMPRGMSNDAAGKRVAIDTQRYDEDEIARIAHDAFELARSRRKKLTSMDKSNVMESGALWRSVVTEIGARTYPDVELEHLFCDNGLFQLGSEPARFDVILSDNLMGDLLSDAAAIGVGSLGMLPSASLGPANENGKRRALYEPVHGSAPDIAGRGIANPMATLLSIAMMAELSFARPDLAERLRRAVDQTASRGILTPDLGGTAGTTEVAQAVLEALQQNLT